MAYDVRMDLRIRQLGPEQWPALEDLFGKSGGDLRHLAASGLVRRTHRGSGVMGALIEAALPVAVLAGAPAVEAYPVDTSVLAHTRNLFPGTASAFARHGFRVVARRKPDRPVRRKVLGATAYTVLAGPATVKWWPTGA